MKLPLDALDEASDDALLVLYGNGDAAAARLLTQRLVPRVLGYATRLLRDRDEAEDVTQEAMLRLWKIAADWRPGEAKPATWLFRVATNLCLDRLRRKGNVALEEVAEPADPHPGAEEGLQDTDRAEALEAALHGLPDRQRQAVVLRHLEGLSNPEIAQVMDISVEAVESLTARGKRALAQSLAPRKSELGYQNG